MFSLLTLFAPKLPSLCPVKPFAALVLLLVSALRFGLAAVTLPVCMAEWEPQPASTTAKKRRKPAEKCVLRIAPQKASRPEIRRSAYFPLFVFLSFVLSELAVFRETRDSRWDFPDSRST